MLQEKKNACRFRTSAKKSFFFLIACPITNFIKNVLTRVTLVSVIHQAISKKKKSVLNSMHNLYERI